MLNLYKNHRSIRRVYYLCFLKQTVAFIRICECQSVIEISTLCYLCLTIIDGDANFPLVLVAFIYIYFRCLQYVSLQFDYAVCVLHEFYVYYIYITYLCSLENTVHRNAIEHEKNDYCCRNRRGNFSQRSFKYLC